MSDERKPFEPKGKLPEWRMIYDNLLESADFGTVITYEQLDAALGRRFIDNREPLRKATRHLGEMRKRWLTVVPTVGYRVIEAKEHIHVSQQHKRRARKQLGTMVKIGEVTDIDRLDAEDLKKWQDQTRVNAMLAMIVTQHEQRLRKLEEIIYGKSAEGKTRPI